MGNLTRVTCTIGFLAFCILVGCPTKSLCVQPIKLLGSQLGWAQLTTGCWKESRLGLRPALLPLRPALLPLRAFILPLRLALLPPTGCLSPSPPSPPPRTGGRRWPGSDGSVVQGGDLPIFSTMITRVITSRTTAVQTDLNYHIWCFIQIPRCT